MHYLYSAGFLICCMGLPLQAKDISPSIPSPSSIHAKDRSEKTSTASKQESKAPTTVASTSTSKKPKAPAPTTKVSSSSTASASSDKKKSVASKAKDGGRLARLTAYWAGEGDYYTGHGLSSTGCHLHGGHCAVDPRIIPYGSTVKIDGLGSYLAVDTGSAVISREAAREAGHTDAERSALVIDLFFEHRKDGEKFAANGPKFASISWQAPRSADNEPKHTSSLYAQQSSDKPHNKPL